MCPPPAPAPEDLPSIGEGYTLTGKLGEGAFGEVFTAHHELLDQQFAVKMLKPELCEDENTRARFLDEARALIQFSHPNIVQVRHVGEHAGRLFLVMDFVDGVELTDLMRKDGPFEEARALHIIKQILSGLEAAHAAGIVHRDLKPSNILVQTLPDGTEKASILDFGLSKFSAVDGPAGAHRSITGTIVGTLAYMSPEQIKGDPDIDGRSDLFATGLIFLEMIQGHHPYPGESGIVVAAKLLRDPIPPLETKRASQISHATQSALARALERDRDARFDSVTMFAQALEGKGPPSDTSRVTTIEDAQRELARQEAEARKKARAEKKKSPLPLVIALLVLGGAAAAYFGLGLGQGGDGDDGKGKSDRTVGRVDPAPDRPPTPVEPKPDKSEPLDPPPKRPPGPIDPKPDKSESIDPAPVAPEVPDKPAPTPPEPVAPEQPAPTPPEPVAPDPQPPVPAGDAQALCRQAGKLLTAGKWSEARATYLQAVAGTELTDKLQVTALRGAAESYIAEADGLARSGRTQEALALLDKTIAWLSERYDTYKDIPQASDVAGRQLGFARTHRAEAQVEKARWLQLQGDSEGAQAALAGAKDDYEFAEHELARDGVNYWEFRIRRAEMHRLVGDTQKTIDDVAYTTQTRNVEIPAHMWVAHATALRRAAQAAAAENDTASAVKWAQQAAEIAEDGVSWQDTALSRQQWLDFARVLFVATTVQPAETDPTARHGKLRWWVSEAAKKAPAAGLHPDVARARLATARAMEKYVEGRVRQFQKNDKAGASFAEAEKLIDQAISLRKAVDAAGGMAMDGLPYEVQAAILEAQGESVGATAAQNAARQAGQVNPD